MSDKGINDGREDKAPKFPHTGVAFTTYLSHHKNMPHTPNMVWYRGQRCEWGTPAVSDNINPYPI